MPIDYLGSPYYDFEPTKNSVQVESFNKNIRPKNHNDNFSSQLLKEVLKQRSTEDIAKFELDFTRLTALMDEYEISLENDWIIENIEDEIEKFFEGNGINSLKEKLIIQLELVNYLERKSAQLREEKLEEERRIRKENERKRIQEETKRRAQEALERKEELKILLPTVSNEIGLENPAWFSFKNTQNVEIEGKTLNISEIINECFDVFKIRGKSYGKKFRDLVVKLGFATKDFNPSVDYFSAEQVNEDLFILATRAGKDNSSDLTFNGGLTLTTKVDDQTIVVSMSSYFSTAKEHLDYADMKDSLFVEVLKEYALDGYKSNKL